MFEGRAASPAAAPLAGALRRDRFAKAFFMYSLHIAVLQKTYFSYFSSITGGGV